MKQRLTPTRSPSALRRSLASLRSRPTVAPSAGATNLKPIMTWHDPAVRQQLKLLAVENDKTEQKLMQEALNLLFAKHGKPQIA